VDDRRTGHAQRRREAEQDYADYPDTLRHHREAAAAVVDAVVMPLVEERDRLRAAIGDAWEAFGYDRSGARSSSVEFGPAGGPLVTVKEAHDYTLAEFITTVTPELENVRTRGDAAIKRAEAAEAERDYLNRLGAAIQADRDAARASHQALTEAVRAAAHSWDRKGDAAQETAAARSGLGDEKFLREHARTLHKRASEVFVILDEFGATS